MKAVLVAAGDIAQGEWFNRQLTGADLLIAVDGGLGHILAAGRMPDLLVGDLDSVLHADLERAAAVARVTYPQEKDDTDLELAVKEAISAGATELVLLATFGSRRDQELANLLLAARLRRNDRLDVSLAGAGTLAWPLAAPDELLLPCPAGTTFSVVALEPGCRVSIGGARYEVSNRELKFGSGLGISNEVRTDTVVTAETGLVLVLAVTDAV